MSNSSNQSSQNKNTSVTVPPPSKQELRENPIQDSQQEITTANEPFDAKSQQLHWPQFAMSLCLLLVALLMGYMINALGNDTPIRATFKVAPPGLDPRPGQLPNNIMSVGFLFPFGGLVGALVVVYLIGEFGRKYVTLLLLQFMIIGNVLKCISPTISIGLLFLGRFFDGFSSGGLMVSAISWLLEIVPQKSLPFVKPFIQILVNVGLLLVGAINLDVALGLYWFFSYFVPVAISIMLSFVCLFIPESHKYIYSKFENEHKARAILQKLRGVGYDDKELDHIVAQVKAEKQTKKITMKSFITSRRYRMCIFITIFINLMQQVTGINAIVAFAPTILTSAGLPSSDESALIILGLALGGSIIFAPLVSKYPRKLMLMIGFCGMTISFSLAMIVNVWFGATIGVVVFLGFFVFIFQVGPGPLTWFICAEIFPPQAFGPAQGIGTIANWFGNMCIFLLFPLVQTAIQLNSLYIFIILNLFTVIVIFFMVEETLNREPHEIVNSYVRRWTPKRTTTATD